MLGGGSLQKITFTTACEFQCIQLEQFKFQKTRSCITSIMTNSKSRIFVAVSVLLAAGIFFYVTRSGSTIPVENGDTPKTLDLVVPLARPPLGESAVVRPLAQDEIRVNNDGLLDARREKFRGWMGIHEDTWQLDAAEAGWSNLAAGIEIGRAHVPPEHFMGWKVDFLTAMASTDINLLKPSLELISDPKYRNGIWQVAIDRFAASDPRGMVKLPRRA